MVYWSSRVTTNRPFVSVCVDAAWKRRKKKQESSWEAATTWITENVDSQQLQSATRVFAINSNQAEILAIWNAIKEIPEEYRNVVIKTDSLVAVKALQHPSKAEEELKNGKKCVAKEVVEAVDEEKKSVRFKVIEGDLLKEFKSISFSIHVVPKGETTAVMWVAEFEKIADDGPYPTKIMDFCIHITRDIEKHHLKD
uniref:Bet v I/Major latex protein domain-containing protein n=1 Tax=Chenopodium quinoa TaxID=63459 RepID=A0A803MK90_CHEQI